VQRAEGVGSPPSPLRSVLELVEGRLEAGERGEPLLAFVAGGDVELHEDELRPARRRAMLVLAAGGDPRRELEIDSRAVLVLADDLDSPERRGALLTGLAALRAPASGLQRVSRLLAELEADSALAWRAYAWALLAEELE
jgi:hypothetical protein